VEVKNDKLLADFLTLLVENAGDFLGTKEIAGVLGSITPERGFFGAKKKFGNAISSLPVDEIAKRVKALTDLLASSFGLNVIAERVEGIYITLEKKYSRTTVSRIIMPLIPSDFLEKYRLQYLTKEELEALVLEKDRINKELRLLDQKKTEFIGIVAHQLRTPLSGVKWALDMVLRGMLGPLSDELQSFLSKCYNSNERMLSLINDMLDADRIDSDIIKYNLMPAQILDLVINILVDTMPDIKKRKLRLSFVHKNRNVPKVRIDSEQMRLAIQNILDNAIKYTLPGGEITIDFQTAGEFVQVSVKDTGIGISEENKKNIFTRFFRSGKAIKMETDGSGLGLFIAKGIIEKHGGRIWFESKEGEGSVFMFTIPISK